MALVLIVLAAVGVAVLAQFFGYDSRETIRSKEQELASFGMTRDLALHEQELADQMAAALQKSLVRPAELKQGRSAGSISQAPPRTGDITASAVS